MVPYGRKGGVAVNVLVQQRMDVNLAVVETATKK